MSDEQITLKEEQNLRNPKNRFLGFLYHANEVDNDWGCKCPFWVGVVITSFFTGVLTLYDIRIFTLIRAFIVWINGYTVGYLIRWIADVISIVGIVYAIISIIKSHYKSAFIAYYCSLIVFYVNVCYTIFCIFLIFTRWRSIISLNIISWFLTGFILLIHCWFLFCNMVYIGRRNRQMAAANSFI